jgi:hypothetical protein
MGSPFNWSHGCQLGRYRIKCERTARGGLHLHGVAPAQGHGDSIPLCEIVKTPRGTGRTGIARAFERSGMESAAPAFDGQQLIHRSSADEQLNRRRRLHRGDDCGDRSENSRRVTRWQAPRRRGHGKKASQAGSLSWPNRHHASFGPNARAIHPRKMVFDRNVIQQIARLGVIRSVEDQIASDDLFGVAGMKISHQRFDEHVAIDRAETIGGRHSALGTPSRASASSKSTCRCRLVCSTTSRSTIRTWPTPPRTSWSAMTHPSAPQPIRTARDLAKRACPAAPICGRSICRWYRFIRRGISKPLASCRVGVLAHRLVHRKSRWASTPTLQILSGHQCSTHCKWLFPSPGTREKRNRRTCCNGSLQYSTGFNRGNYARGYAAHSRRSRQDRRASSPAPRHRPLQASPQSRRRRFRGHPPSGRTRSSGRCNPAAASSRHSPHRCQQQTIESLQNKIVSHIKIKALNMAQVEFVDLLRKITQTIQKPLNDAPAAQPAGPRLSGIAGV